MLIHSLISGEFIPSIQKEFLLLSGTLQFNLKVFFCDVMRISTIRLSFDLWLTNFLCVTIYLIMWYSMRRNIFNNKLETKGNVVNVIHKGSRGLTKASL